MHQFELSEALDGNGWVCRGAVARKERKYIADESAKHWYLGGHNAYGQLNKFSIILLLTAI
eukprot:7815203-Prorocentrum_lima.AAC.1